MIRPGTTIRRFNGVPHTNILLAVPTELAESLRATAARYNLGYAEWLSLKLPNLLREDKLGWLARKEKQRGWLAYKEEQLCEQLAAETDAEALAAWDDPRSADPTFVAKVEKELESVRGELAELDALKSGQL